MKKADPSHQITVHERNGRDDTFGFGVVFSDATLGKLGDADPDSYAEIRRHFAHWDAIDIHHRGEVIRSVGHGFCGLGRKALLGILQRRCAELGVEMRFHDEVPDADALAGADLVLLADGVASASRDKYADAFQPTIDTRPNKFVWLGTTFPFEAFTFYFNQNQHGLWRVHAYRYQDQGSTFIVECTEETWRRAGMDRADEQATIAYLEQVFAGELAGHRLIANRSIWRNFPNISNRRWHHRNMVLVGDAVHTAHFSIGSGTKLAMEDCIALAEAVNREPDLDSALAAYERDRRPEVESLQRAAQVSLEWFENTERYLGLEPLPFAFSLLTRSLRVTHDNLRRRDPALVDAVDRWFAGRAAAAVGEEAPAGEPPPPMLTPLRLRGLGLANRIAVAPLRLDAAAGGVVGDDHLVFLGSRALGGAALVHGETAAVSRDGLWSPTGAGLWTGEQAAAWRRIGDYVRGAGAAFGLPLGHAGTAAPAALAGELAAAAALAEGVADLIAIDASSGAAAGWVRAGATADLVALVRAVRERWSGPLGVRLGAGAAGVTGQAAVDLAGELRQAGCDLIAVVALADDGSPRRLAAAGVADWIRQQLGVTTLLEGGVWSWDDANSVLAAGRADLVGLGRTHLVDPYFTRRAALAQGHPLAWPHGHEAAAGFVPR